MSLTVCRTTAEFRDACNRLRGRGERLGLVPTMGALHEGHLALVDHAKSLGATVALTIFVNPTQFGPTEDLHAYPRPIEKDLEFCRSRGVWAAFVPPEEEMYPKGERTRVRVTGLSDALCGPRRPGHFEGVATIVAKLFAVAGPCIAVFGRKDYQQLQVIRRMVLDLLLPVEVIGYPTVRERDGLALSSRNAYLNEVDRRKAVAISRALADAVQRFRGGERQAENLRAPVEAALLQSGFRIDYVELASADELVPFSSDARVPERALLAVAAFLGTTRLIDNVVLGEDPSPPP